MYRAASGRPALLAAVTLSEGQLTEEARLEASVADPRDYDVEHYVRSLRDNFASRLERALTPDDFAVAFADPRQLSLFAGRLSAAQAVLTRLGDRASLAEFAPPSLEQG